LVVIGLIEVIDF